MDDGRLGVVLRFEDAKAVAGCLHDAPACWGSREALLEGHVEKLENRLRAVQ